MCPASCRIAGTSGSDTNFCQPSASQSKSTQTLFSSTGSRNTVEPLEPCCPRFSAPLVEKTLRKRSTSSTFVVARIISVLPLSSEIAGRALGLPRPWPCSLRSVEDLCNSGFTLADPMSRTPGNSALNCCAQGRWSTASREMASFQRRGFWVLHVRVHPVDLPLCHRNHLIGGRQRVVAVVRAQQQGSP